MARILLLWLGLFALAGCAESGSAVHSVATAGLAAAIGSATGNPVLGLVAGVAASYGADQGVKYGERRIQGTVQNAIVAAAVPLEVGQAAPWRVAETLPLTGKSGTVEVARAFGEAIPCKDVVFTVESDPAVYVTTLCRGGDGEWRWAEAEPTVPAGEACSRGRPSVG